MEGFKKLKKPPHIEVVLDKRKLLIDKEDIEAQDLPCGGIRLKLKVGKNNQVMEIAFSEYTEFEEVENKENNEQ